MHPRTTGGTKAGQEWNPLTCAECALIVLNLTHSESAASDRSGRAVPTPAASSSSGLEGATGASAGVPGGSSPGRVRGSGARDRQTWGRSL